MNLEPRVLNPERVSQSPGTLICRCIKGLWQGGRPRVAGREPVARPEVAIEYERRVVPRVQARRGAHIYRLVGRGA